LSCNYAIAVASEAPEVCSRLILLSPLTVYESQQRSGWLTSLVRTPLIGFSLYAFLTLRPILREVIARRHGCKYSEVMPDDLQSAYAAAHQFGAHRAVLALLAGKMDLESRRQLEGLGQPVIMIWGEKAVLALENLPAIAKDTEVVVIQESGLRPHEDRASTVVTHILDMGDGERLAGPITIEDTVVSNHQSVTVTLNQQKMETVEAVDANVFVEQPGRSVEQTLDAGVMGDEKETEDSGSLTETVENQQQEEVEAYCVKCKQKRIMQGAHRITTKNGRNAMEGSCPVCGTRLFRFIAR
jgi:hypothetical protein